MKLCFTDHLFQTSILEVGFVNGTIMWVATQINGWVVQRFAKAISSCFAALSNPIDPVVLWDTYKCKMHLKVSHSRSRLNFILQVTLEAS